METLRLRPAEAAAARVLVEPIIVKEGVFEVGSSLSCGEGGVVHRT